MNNMAKRIMILFLFILLLSIPLTSADSSQYSITSTIKDITIQDDATTIITENISYEIHSPINGTYRQLPTDGQQSISDISVETPGYYNTVEVINSTGNVTIKVWLYTDAEKTHNVENGRVDVIYHYRYNKAVKAYNDINEFQYMSWGGFYENGVDNLTTIIHLPGSISECEYWNNPDTHLVEQKEVNDTTLITSYSNIASKETVEQRIIMPKSFIKNTDNADVITKDAKSTIEQDQKDYKFNQDIKNNFGYITAAISVIFVLLQGLIYLIYGRDKKGIHSNAIQSEIPSDDSPVFINAIFNNPLGQIDSNAYNAILLDLIDKKYFKVIMSTEDDTIIKRTNKDVSSLKRYERDVYDYVIKYENNESMISFRQMSENKGLFSNFMNAWDIDVKYEVSSLKLKRYYEERGRDYSIYLAAASIIFSIISILAILFVFKNGASNTIGLIFAVLLIIVAIIVFSLPAGIMGRWTEEGREFHDKWQNFRNFLCDYSLIKERPPASIQVWGRYLVYATALGCADEVSKNMKRLFNENKVSQEVIAGYDVISLSYLGFYGFYIPHHYNMNSQNTSPFSDGDFGGSFGDIGGPGSGGFGGGGGGVF